jgi:phenylacetate-CoA ligase
MREMCNLEFEPLQRQRMNRMHLLRELLVHAYREVDLYRMKLDNAGIDPVEVSYPRSFARVPITSKHELRQGFPHRQLARSSRGSFLRYSNTSGTTGRPLLLVQDIRDISYKYASILRSRAVAGVDPMSSQVRLTPNECQPCLSDGQSPSTISGLPQRQRPSFFVFLEKQVVLPFFHQRQMLEPFWAIGSKGGPVDYDAYVELIRAAEPEVLSIYPLYALLLARHIKRNRLSPPRIQRLIDFSAGLATPKMSAFIRDVFGVRTAQSCGGCEFARYAASCPDDPDRMHLAEDYAYVETVRPDGSLAAPGELGNVLVTSLHSRAMPIIRLEPGDVGRLIDDPCACGRRSRRLQHGGRIQSLIRNADSRWVTGAEIWDEVLFVPGVELFQLQQIDEENYTAHVVESPDRTLDKPQFIDTLKSLLGHKADIAVRVVSAIAPEPSGKLQLVKSSTFEDFRPQSAASKHSVPVN